MSTIGPAIFSGKKIPAITAKANIAASIILTLVISLTTYGDYITPGRVEDGEKLHSMAIEIQARSVA
jgi:hypothetical protein